uniref:Uncharacterized protein n=1 Tax=Panagrellus redivivus TaxID=6233 RepID=A0A7E4WAW9_PANRE
MGNHNSVIKRFTHDWLIRFIELHPFETVFDTHMDSTARFGPEQSTFNKISPYFSNLLQRYMPDAITDAVFKQKKLFIKLDIVDDDAIKEVPLSSSNKKAVVIIRSVDFDESIAGTLTNYYQKRVFWMYETSCFGSSLTPAELFYLAKHTKKSLKIYMCSLTETVSFSVIWPCIKHLDSIVLNIKNLDIGEDIKETLLYKPCEFSADCFSMSTNSIAEDIIMAFIECFLNCPKFPNYFEWKVVNPKLKNVNFKQIGEKIYKRMKAAGYVWRSCSKIADHLGGDDNALIMRTADNFFLLNTDNVEY